MTEFGFTVTECSYRYFQTTITMMKTQQHEELMCKTEMNIGNIVATVKFFFTEEMVTIHGHHKGILRINDPDYALHSRRIDVSPYRNDPDKVIKASNLECLVSTSLKTLGSPDMLILNFLEKCKPAS